MGGFPRRPTPREWQPIKRRARNADQGAWVTLRILVEGERLGFAFAPIPREIRSYRFPEVPAFPFSSAGKPARPSYKSYPSFLQIRPDLPQNRKLVREEGHGASSLIGEAPVEP